MGARVSGGRARGRGSRGREARRMDRPGPAPLRAAGGPELWGWGESWLATRTRSKAGARASVAAGIPLLAGFGVTAPPPTPMLRAGRRGFIHPLGALRGSPPPRLRLGITFRARLRKSWEFARGSRTVRLDAPLGCAHAGAEARRTSGTRSRSHSRGPRWGGAPRRLPAPGSSPETNSPGTPWPPRSAGNDGRRRRFWLDGSPLPPPAQGFSFYPAAQRRL